MDPIDGEVWGMYSQYCREAIEKHGEDKVYLHLSSPIFFEHWCTTIKPKIEACDFVLSVFSEECFSREFKRKTHKKKQTKSCFAPNLNQADAVLADRKRKMEELILGLEFVGFHFSIQYAKNVCRNGYKNVCKKNVNVVLGIPSRTKQPAQIANARWRR